jgi:hypothetical protein
MGITPIETWRREVGYNPFHFWQMTNQDVPVTSSCNSLVYEYSWQNVDTLGRSDVRAAIKNAHNQLREFLGYRVGLEHVSKRDVYPYDGRIHPQNDGLFRAINLNEGYIKKLGVPAYTPLGNEPLVYSDSDSDGVFDTFTTSVAIPVGMTYDELVLKVPSANRPAWWEEEQAIIRPVKVEVAAGVATFTGSLWLMAQPLLYERVIKTQIDPADYLDPTVFLQDVDIEATFTDAAGQNVDDAPLVLHYEATGCGADWLLGCPSSLYWQNMTTSTYGGARVYNVPATGFIRDSRRGEIVIPAWRRPDWVTVRYQAGADSSELNELNINSGDWLRIVVRLSAALLANRICTCDSANRKLYEWQFDRARAAGSNDEQYTIGESDLNNPFGTRAGQIYAWKMVRNLMLTRAFVTG